MKNSKFRKLGRTLFVLAALLLGVAFIIALVMTKIVVLKVLSVFGLVLLCAGAVFSFYNGRRTEWTKRDLMMRIVMFAIVAFIAIVAVATAILYELAKWWLVLLVAILVMCIAYFISFAAKIRWYKFFTSLMLMTIFIFTLFPNLGSNMTLRVKELFVENATVDEVNATEVNATEVNATEVNATEVNATEVNATKVNATEVNATKVNATEVNATEVNATKVNATEVNATKVNATEVNATKVNATETNLGSNQTAPAVTTAPSSFQTTTTKEPATTTKKVTTKEPATTTKKVTTKEPATTTKTPTTTTKKSTTTKKVTTTTAKQISAVINGWDRNETYCQNLSVVFSEAVSDNDVIIECDGASIRRISDTVYRIKYYITDGESGTVAVIVKHNGKVLADSTFSF